MNQHSNSYSHGLPPHVRRDPEMIAWRLDQHAEQLQQHHHRLTALEQIKVSTKQSWAFLAQIPWVQVLPALLALTAMLFSNVSLEQAIAIYKSLKQ